MHDDIFQKSLITSDNEQAKTLAFIFNLQMTNLITLPCHLNKRFVLNLSNFYIYTLAKHKNQNIKPY